MHYVFLIGSFVLLFIYLLVPQEPVVSPELEAAAVKVVRDWNLTGGQ